MSSADHDRSWTATVWGSRGSVAVATPETSGYGGHTTCFELDLPDGRIFVDAGSGLADYARRKPWDGKRTLLLFSHLHWDHVVGFPFFTPLFTPGWHLDVRGVPREGRSVFDAVRDLNRPPIFPVDLHTSIRADVTSDDLPPQGELEFAGARVEWMEVAHPGGCTTFALCVGAQRIVVTGDVELPNTDRDALAEFCRGADALVCDSQYTPAEYVHHVGWGHSTYEHAAELAAAADVKRLWLSHHDPSHEDALIDELVEAARKLFPATEGARNHSVVASGTM